MTIRLTLIISALFLFVAFAIGAVFTTRACFLAGPGTGYPSLQEAVDRADAGCTIMLLGGTYEENVVIDKPLRIVPRAESQPFAILGQAPSGTSSAAAFIDPASPSTLRATNADQPVVDIRSSHVTIRGLRIEGGRVGVRASGVRDIRIAGNTIRGTQKAGIRFDGVEASRLRGNTVARTNTGVQLVDTAGVRVVNNGIRRNEHGIRLTGATSHILRGNEIAANDATALYLTSSSDNVIRANAIERNAVGINMEAASANTLAANRLNGNDAGLRIKGSKTAHYVHRISRDNTIDGRPIYYLVDAKGATIEAETQPSYVALVRSQNVTVRGVALPEGSQGLLMIDTRDSRVVDVTIPDSEQGLLLRGSHDNVLKANRIEGTEASGIVLRQSSGNRIERNVVEANGGHGVLFKKADANKLINNQIRGNEESGVRLSQSRGVLLTENGIRNNWVGVYLDGGGNHRIEGNTVAKCQFAVYVEGTGSNQFANNRLAENRHAANQPGLIETGATESEK
ncbi:MAG: NosD domain-containing protein [Candidatus Bipolaricaulia bacterium]